MHLDAGYDSTHTRDLLTKLGCQGVISKKGFPPRAGARWVVGRATLGTTDQGAAGDLSPESLTCGRGTGGS